MKTAILLSLVSSIIFGQSEIISMIDVDGTAFDMNESTLKQVCTNRYGMRTETLNKSKHKFMCKNDYLNSISPYILSKFSVNHEEEVVIEELVKFREQDDCESAKKKLENPKYNGTVYICRKSKGKYDIDNFQLTKISLDSNIGNYEKVVNTYLSVDDCKEALKIVEELLGTSEISVQR